MMFNQGMFGGYDGGRGIGAQRFAAFGGQQQMPQMQMPQMNAMGGYPQMGMRRGYPQMPQRVPMSMNPWAGSAQDPYASMGNQFSLRSLLGGQSSRTMSNEFQYQPRGGGLRYDAGPQTGGNFNPMVGSNMPSVMPTPMQMSASDQYTPSADGMGQSMAISRYEQPAPLGQPNYASPSAAPAAPPQQTLEQFTATLGNPGAYTSGQIGDMYQQMLAKSQAQSVPPTADYTWKPPTLPGGPGTPPSGNPTTPTNPGTGNPGTGNPSQPTGTGGIGNGAQPPSGFYQGLWDAQRNGQLGFSAMDPRGDPRVTMQNAWFYGMDALGRPINQQTNAAYPTFRGAADGFTRTRPWIGG